MNSHLLYISPPLEFPINISSTIKSAKFVLPVVAWGGADDKTKRQEASLSNKKLELCDENTNNFTLAAA